MRWLTIAVVLIAGEAAAGPLEDGVQLYADGDYAAAAEALREAYDLEPDRQTLFAWAQAERMSGDCETARRLYQQVLDDDPPQEQAIAVRKVLALCPESEPVPVPVPVPLPAPERESNRPPRWYSDVLGGVLLSSGVIAGAFGGYFVVQSSATYEDAAMAPTHGVALSLDHRADRERVTGVSLVGAAAALVIGSVLRYSF